ncbi:MAG: flagellar assembly factor FliW [Actinomycetota bacterium]|nr:flagellar assembly factor FliW [Actinomycetota bacterium]
MSGVPLQGRPCGEVIDPGAEDLPEIELVRPMPGFDGLTRFFLVQLDDRDGEADPVLYELRSVEQPEVRFLVGVPTAFFPDYTFELDEPACSDLDLRDAEEALVLVLVTSGDDSLSTTANLLAPVVINARTRSAAQVILSGTTWPVRAAIA